jgi:multidrug efflux pump subunit AcrA (membrane-fusion protein)
MISQYQRRTRVRMAVLSAAAIVATAFCGCGRHSAADPTVTEPEEHREPSVTNRIDIPPAVRQNLGLTFAKVEERAVRRTMRLPGQFEHMPRARRDYRVVLAGQVDLTVQQYQRVEVGDVLFRLESPEWRRIQSKLAEAFKACYCCLPELDAARAAQRENEAQIEFLERRIANLAAAEARNVDLESELSRLERARERLDAEVRAKKADRVSAELAYSVLLNEAVSVTGIDRTTLEASLPTDADGGPVPPGRLAANGPDGPGGGPEADDEPLVMPGWTAVGEIVVRAQADGVVNRIGVTDHGWAETGDLVLETIDPDVVRFHADALQTDIGRLDEGMRALVVPPPGGSIPLQDTIEGTITIGFQAHADDRTVPVYLVPTTDLPRWAKAGVTAYLEVFVNGSEDPEPAIPKSCVARDGLDLIFFRRDPKDKDKVIRVVADLGPDDGRWVVVHSGVKVGDEVVLDGVYPLLLASSSQGQAQAAGHFHADGTFHEKADH